MDVEDVEAGAAPKGAFADYVFTWHGSKAVQGGESHVIKTLSLLAFSEYQFSLEKAPSTGNLHWQGYVCFKRKCTIKRLAKLMPGIHWEVMAGTVAENREYTAKEETHVDGPWNSGFKVWRDLVTGLEGVEWHPWQTKVKELVATPPDMRSFHWFHGPVDIGKSSMVRWLIDNTQSLIIDGSSKKTDVVNTLRNRLSPSTGEGTPIDAVVISFKAGETVGFDYSILEMLKDMYAVNVKYECLPLRWAPVHVIVFANETPTIVGDPKRWKIEGVGFESPAL